MCSVVCAYTAKGVTKMSRCLRLNDWWYETFKYFYLQIATGVWYLEVNLKTSALGFIWGT